MIREDFYIAIAEIVRTANTDEEIREQSYLVFDEVQKKYEEVINFWINEYFECKYKQRKDDEQIILED